jgi:hypothetical protein
LKNIAISMSSISFHFKFDVSSEVKMRKEWNIPNFLTRSQVTGWNPLEGFTKSSCGKLRFGGTLPASNFRKG